MPQEHVGKGEQREEEEAELNHEGQIELCPRTLWDPREIHRVKKLTGRQRFVHSLGG